LPNQHKLSFRSTFPLGVIQREALAAEVKDVALGAFIKPEDAFCTENRCRKLRIQEMLELLDSEGAIALKRNRGKSIDR
jgi:hypothetical protein